MEKSTLILESSPWFIAICLLVGGLVAYMLYKKRGPWSNFMQYLLTGLRFLLVSLLCFLLVGPIIKQFKNHIEKPQIVLAIDNSASLEEVMDSSQLYGDIQKVKDLGAKLAASGNLVEFRTLEKVADVAALDSLAFDLPATPLNDLMQGIQTDYEGKNLKGVVLFSDGIHNQGLSPVFVPYRFPINTMGWGDTIPQKDISLKAIQYNKIAYQGNQFIIRAEILNEGFFNETVEISVMEGNRVLQRNTLALKSSPQLLETDFTLDASSKGLKDYRIQIKAVPGEFTESNNFRHAYIDIIEGQRKILLAAKSPHPDIKAVKNALGKNQNYQLELYIPGVSNPQSDTYDLIILHQISKQEAAALPVISNMLKSGTPVWNILGSKSNLNRFNSENELVKIEPINFQRDQVTASVNTSFSKFQLSDPLRDMLGKNSPVNVPFANYSLSGGTEVLLSQKVGNLVTDNPLLAVLDDGDQKSAVMIGEGIWLWRLQDFAQNQSFELFDELIGKLVQYLSTNDDKSRFRVYPISSEFHVNVPAILETEVYNQIYEKTYGHNIDLDLRGPDGRLTSYNYTTSLGNSRYRISDLPAGVYTFSAKTTVEDQLLTSNGQFSITELQLESLNLTANHQLLRSLSEKANGKFYGPEQWDSLTQDLTRNQAQGIIFSEEAFVPFIKWPLALATLLLLVALEWFFRKYHGSY